MNHDQKHPVATSVKMFGRSIPVPATRWGRMALGWALVGGGMLGFMPILGFWMMPLGLFVLSIDSPWLRRRRRRCATRFGRWRKRAADRSGQ